MNLIVSIAAGGARGAVGRYGVSIGTTSAFGHGFPWGTLIVNILGSFVMGVLVALFAHLGNPSQEMRAFLTVGVLGAMTTFSTFSLDTVTLFERGDYMVAAAYSGASVFFSIAALFAGLFIVRQLVV
jgi:CrcB protein